MDTTSDQRVPDEPTLSADTLGRTNDPLPSPTVGQQSNLSDTFAEVSDTNVGHEAKMSDSGGHRPTHYENLSDNGRQRRTEEEKDVGHDPDLSPRDSHHNLSTYEAAKLFDEAEARVSERTIIRWCNKNKRGERRLDCAFDENDRKYYISEESVKKIIREERQRGRQSNLFTPDLTDIKPMSDEEEGLPTESVGQDEQVVRQWPPTSDTNVGHEAKMSDSGGHRPTQDEELSDHVGHNPRRAEHQPSYEDPIDKLETMRQENMELRIQVLKLEEQGKTKDEMMTFLRKEIDRRGEQVMEDRATYNKSLDWFRAQVEAKDAAIERLNTEVRGLLEAPKGYRPPSSSGESGSGTRAAP